MQLCSQPWSINTHSSNSKKKKKNTSNLHFRSNFESTILVKNSNLYNFHSFQFHYLPKKRKKIALNLLPLKFLLIRYHSAKISARIITAGQRKGTRRNRIERQIEARSNAKLDLTFHERGRESGLLHRPIANKLHQKFVARRLDVRRYLVTAVNPDQRRVRVMTVPHLHVVVNAIVVILDLERLKLQRHLEVLGHGQLPHALLARLITVRVVGRFEMAGVLQLDFATANGLVGRRETTMARLIVGRHVCDQHSTSARDHRLVDFTASAVSTCVSN